MSSLRAISCLVTESFYSDSCIPPGIQNLHLFSTFLVNRRISRYLAGSSQPLPHNSPWGPVWLTQAVPGRTALFCISSNTLASCLSSQSSSGPAGGASDGCGLGRGAAPPVYDYRGWGAPSHRLGRIPTGNATGTDRERSKCRT